MHCFVIKIFWSEAQIEIVFFEMLHLALGNFCRLTIDDKTKSDTQK